MAGVSWLRSHKLVFLTFMRTTVVEEPWRVCVVSPRNDEPLLSMMESKKLTGPCSPCYIALECLTFIPGPSFL